MKNTIIICLFFTFLGSCAPSDRVSKRFTDILNKENKNEQIKLKFNGVYHRISNLHLNYGTDFKNGVATRFIDSPYIEHPLFFFENSNMMFYNWSPTYEANELDYFKGTFKNGYYANKYSSGVFNIIGDTIFASDFINFPKGILAPVVNYKLCFFKGILKNRDTIINWQLVPPFPKVQTSFSSNVNLLALLKTPINLYFKAIPEKNYIDISKSWLDKYRTNK